MGVENSETRVQLIEAAAQIVEKEGYAAVTARRLAEQVGLKREIVHYYFRTIEDVLLAVIRRDGERVRNVLTSALESQEPLTAIWQGNRHTTATISEFIALAAHRKAIRSEVKRYLEEFRSIQTKALVRHLERRGIKCPLAPVAIVYTIQSLAQTLAIEASLDVSDGHAEVEAVIEESLRAFAERGELVVSGRKPARSRRSPSR
jgi:AcrR family transcriptional regulator